MQCRGRVAWGSGLRVSRPALCIPVGIHRTDAAENIVGDAEIRRESREGVSERAEAFGGNDEEHAERAGHP